MRHFSNVALISLLLFGACQMGKETPVSKLNELVAPLYDSSLKPFYHGVASGDPKTDRVILWTRVTPEDSVQGVPVQWEIADINTFEPVLKTDTLSALASKDYTVKIDVDGLQPGKYYYYRFKAFGQTSAVGRTKTLPVGQPDSIKFAVVSCSNWEFGYFNAYSCIAEKDVDAVLHLGDYIYEYGTGRYGNKNVDRKNIPAHEIVSLQDYRARYSQYHLDAGLRAVRQQHPLITIWDDHEVANNVYASGAQNHQPDKEGDFNARKAAAKQAYYEWIPIRESDKHYRSFTFGNLAELIMLDERLEGRTRQADSLMDQSLNLPGRTMLGKEQLQWFESKLKSTAIWKVIGNQVIFSDVDGSLVNARRPRNLDSWDGYPGEKTQIADYIRQNNIKDIIYLAGDTHAGWAFEVAVDPKRTYNPKTSRGAFAVEFGAPSVSSGNSNEHTTDDTVRMEEANYLLANPHLKYTNHRDHGYLLITLSPEKTRAEWFYVETLLQPDHRERLDKKLEVDKGRFTLR